MQGLHMSYRGQPFLGPREVGEGTVGVSHLVNVFALLNGGALVVVSVKQFGGDAVLHAHAFPSPAGSYEPHCGQVLLALATDFERNLVVGTADTATAGFHVWLNVLVGLLEDI